MIDNGEDWLKPSPREVKEAMHLLLRFQLFLNDAATDSLMREIALKQGNVSGNLLRYDKEFASNFIHLLCLMSPFAPQIEDGLIRSFFLGEAETH